MADLAAIIEEGERLEREAKAAWRNSSIASAKEATWRLREWRNVWYPALLAVCRAAVEVLADHDERVRLYPEDHAQPHKVKVMDALRAAVRGDAATGEGR